MSQIDPLLKPDEEEDKEQDHSTQRAFFAGVFREHEGALDGFTGAFRGVPPHKRGGAQHVQPDDTLGAEDLCWCGQLQGHSWPGKASKRPHPRGNQVSAMADEKPYLNPKDLKAFDRKVVRALCDLVNKYGVAYKLTGGTGCVLIPPDATHNDVSERLKVSAHRPAEQSLRFIEQWAIKHVRPAKVEEALPKLAERFNDPTKKVHEKTETTLQQSTRRRSQAASEAHERRAAVPEKPVEKSATVPAASPPPVKPEAPQIETSQASQAAPPEGYEVWVTTKGEVSPWWKKIGATEFMCAEPDCGYECTAVQQFSGHRRIHNQELFSQKRFVSYLTKAAMEMGVDLTDWTMAVDAHKVVKVDYVSRSQADTAVRELEKCQAALAKVTAERDDLQAWKDLILEASR